MRPIPERTGLGKEEHLHIIILQNDATHYSTDRFCGNNLGVRGIRQPIISYTKVGFLIFELDLVN